MIGHELSVVRARVSHPALVLGAVIGLIVDSYYFIGGYHYAIDIMVFVVYALLCAAIPWFPRVAGCSVIMWYLLCVIFPQLNAGFMLAGICIAFATVFAFMNTPVDLALIGICALTLYLTSQADAAIATIILQVVSGLAGYTSKRHMDAVRQRVELAEAHRRVAAMSRDMALATRLHDTVTNDLSYVITVASTGLMDAEDAAHRQTLNAVIERSQDAFAKTHEIIDVLSNPEQRQDPQYPTYTLRKELESGAEMEKGRLQRLGLFGSCTVHGVDTSLQIQPDIHEEIIGLASETFANLRRHCTPPSDYIVIMDIQDHTFTLTSMNTMNGSTTPRLQTSGKGLRMHRDIIASIGGKLTFAPDHGTWTLHAEIPFVAHTPPLSDDNLHSGSAKS